MKSLKDAQILITGGTGFLGSRVSTLLVEVGAKVTRIGRSQFDLRYEGDALTAVLAAQPDLIVHLAAVTGCAPATSFRDNMLIDLNVVHAAAVARAKLVTVGTPSSYQGGGGPPHKESSFWTGFLGDSFGVAKRALHEMCRAYRAQFGLRYGYLIPASLYGPGMRGDHTIPSLAKLFARAVEGKAKEVTCCGTGKTLYSFLHVDDAAMAVAVACEKLDSDEIVNLPGGLEISLEKLATQIASLIGYQGTMKWDESKSDGRMRIIFDGTRASKLLGWKPVIPFEDGLHEVVKQISSSGKPR